MQQIQVLDVHFCVKDLLGQKKLSLERVSSFILLPFYDRMHKCHRCVHKHGAVQDKLHSRGELGRSTEFKAGNNRRLWSGIEGVQVGTGNYKILQIRVVASVKQGEQGSRRRVGSK